MGRAVLSLWLVVWLLGASWAYYGPRADGQPVKLVMMTSPAACGAADAIVLTNLEDEQGVPYVVIYGFPLEIPEGVDIDDLEWSPIYYSRSDGKSRYTTDAVFFNTGRDPCVALAVGV